MVSPTIRILSALGIALLVSPCIAADADRQAQIRVYCDAMVAKIVLEVSTDASTGHATLEEQLVALNNTSRKPIFSTVVLERLATAIYERKPTIAPEVRDAVNECVRVRNVLDSSR